MLKLTRIEKIPYIITILIAFTGWGMTHIVNRLLQSPIIEYNLQKSQFVTLKIFDITGQEIETLVNKFQLAGKYQVKLTREGLQSGIYFYRLQAGEFSVTKKLIKIHQSYAVMMWGDLDLEWIMDMVFYS